MLHFATSILYTLPETCRNEISEASRDLTCAWDVISLAGGLQSAGIHLENSCSAHRNEINEASQGLTCVWDAISLAGDLQSARLLWGKDSCSAHRNEINKPSQDLTCVRDAISIADGLHSAIQHYEKELLLSTSKWNQRSLARSNMRLRCHKPRRRPPIARIHWETLLLTTSKWN